MKLGCFLGICTILTLTACAGDRVGKPVQLSDEARQLERTFTSYHQARNTIFPKSSLDQMVSTQKKYCVRPQDDFKNIETDITKDGYKPLAEGDGGLKVFFNMNGSPTVGFKPDVNDALLGNLSQCIVMSGYKSGLEDELKEHIKSLPGFVPVRSKESKLLVSNNAVIEKNSRKIVYAVDDRGTAGLGTVINLIYATKN